MGINRPGMTCFTGIFLALALADSSFPKADGLPQGGIIFKEGLVLPPAGRGGRSALRLDPLEMKIVTGSFKSPRAGETVSFPGGKRATWEKTTAGKDNAFSHKALFGGYAYFPIESDKSRVMILRASGHGMVYVNGEPRVGDIYQTGNVWLPVSLRKGTNHFLFQVPRGRLQARLVEPKGDVFFNTADLLIPDPISGETREVWSAVVVVNATARVLDHLYLEAGLEGQPPTRTSLPSLLPLSIRKVGFRWPSKGGGKEAKILLKLLRQEKHPSARVMDKAIISRRVRNPGEVYQRTFISEIDGSVQYYAVNPARRFTGKDEAPALFLSLHGAGVDATGQAASYAPKSWGHLVAPTNRRPYGFDWEDWGRLDALEVLDIARRELGTDPQRIYLTGHSMGGHGVWHLGATCPDRFAAIGPSAGWISFWTYAAGPRPKPASALESLLLRASNPSDTFALANNYGFHGVYILHGSADNNVPVTQARKMKEILAGFHHDFLYHEQTGAGHWWDASDEPGVDCVDWGPMFDFFARHVIPRPDGIRKVRFTTANPGVSGWCHWVGIEGQLRPLQPSTIDIRCDPGRRRFMGRTENVALLGLDLAQLEPGKPLQVVLDGQKIADIPWPNGGSRPRLWLKIIGKNWRLEKTISPSGKGAHRYGPFRDVFRHRMILVYGTGGNGEENAWALAKARYDAEQFWYRGNGSVDIVADKDFQSTREKDRNVIIYGNAETNSAWDKLLSKSPVQMVQGKITIGDRATSGDKLACMFLRPRPESDVACVGVIGGTGITGMRLTDRMPIFVSGVGLPDWIVFGPETLTEAIKGVRALGYFGLDWGVGSGEFAWRKE